MSLRNLIKLAALASTCWMSVGQALAENRIALVIGNSKYTSVTALPNPANDAKAMTNFLNSAGFQVVQAPDLTQSDMRRTIADFAKKVTEKGPDTVALVFYAGHGLQVDGENYLVPVDAQIERESDVPLQATRLADLMNVLSSVPSKSNIVILDACRNNPFSAINKTAGRGLAIDRRGGRTGLSPCVLEWDREHLCRDSPAARHGNSGRRMCLEIGKTTLVRPIWPQVCPASQEKVEG